MTDSGHFLSMTDKCPIIPMSIVCHTENVQYSLQCKQEVKTKSRRQKPLSSLCWLLSVPFMWLMSRVTTHMSHYSLSWITTCICHVTHCCELPHTYVTCHTLSRVTTHRCHVTLCHESTHRCHVTHCHELPHAYVMCYKLPQVTTHKCHVTHVTSYHTHMSRIVDLTSHTQDLCPVNVTSWWRKTSVTRKLTKPDTIAIACSAISFSVGGHASLRTHVWSGHPVIHHVLHDVINDVINDDIHYVYHLQCEQEGWLVLGRLGLSTDIFS